MDQDSPTRYETFQKISPDAGAAWNGQITVCFSYAQSGWVLLWIATTAYLQHITIHLTDIYNPFLDLFHWLETVSEDQLPAEINIDEEGIGKTLYAASAEDNLIYLQIFDRHEQKKVLWGCRCNKRQLITEFVEKFELFMAQYYQEDEWRLKPGPRGVNLEKLNMYLTLPH